MNGELSQHSSWRSSLERLRSSLHNDLAVAALKGMTAHHERIERESVPIVRRRALSVVRSAWTHSLRPLMTPCFECSRTSPFVPQAPQALRFSHANLEIYAAVR